MIKFLLKAILIVLCLLILIPMIMLLIGEGAVVHKIFSAFAPDDSERTEWVDSRQDNGNCYVDIEDVDVEHNVKDDSGAYGMMVTANATIQNLKGQTLCVLFSFYDKNGKQLKYRGNNDNFKSSEGYMSSMRSFTVKEKDADVDITLFVPYDEFYFSGTGTKHYLLDVSLLYDTGDDDYTVVARSDPFAFHLTFE